jgi:hypothetical protein
MDPFAGSSQGFIPPDFSLEAQKSKQKKLQNAPDTFINYSPGNEEKGKKYNKTGVVTERSASADSDFLEEPNGIWDVSTQKEETDDQEALESEQPWINGQRVGQLHHVSFLDDLTRAFAFLGTDSPRDLVSAQDGYNEVIDEQVAADTEDLVWREAINKLYDGSNGPVLNLMYAYLCLLYHPFEMIIFADFNASQPFLPIFSTLPTIPTSSFPYGHLTSITLESSVALRLLQTPLSLALRTRLLRRSRYSSLTICSQSGVSLIAFGTSTTSQFLYCMGTN